MAYRKAYEPETRNFAYSVWKDEAGQNIDSTCRMMNNKYGYVIPRATLNSWKNKYTWERRAAQAEAEERLMAKDSSYNALLLSLIRQKQKYDEYLDGLPASRIDTQAIYAYNSIVKTIVSIRAQKSNDGEAPGDKSRIFLENMEFIIAVLKKTDPEGVKVIDRNFEKIIYKFKQVEQGEDETQTETDRKPV